jgi:polar amino acid transport system substrate-binding protein
VKQLEQNYRTGRLRLAETPVPRPGAGSALIATRVSLISTGTEKQAMDLAKASLAGKAVARPDLVRRVIRNVQRDGLRPTIEKVFAKLDTPIPLGYSLCGEVIEAGRNFGGMAAGTRIACAGAGIANHAEYNVVPKNLSVRIPDSIDDEDASFVTLGAIALQGVRQAAPTLGERVVVMGLGLIGLLTVQLLKANGCRVLGFDPNLERVKLAASIGADMAVGTALSEAVHGFTDGHGADAVILTASTKSSEPLNLAAEISRMKGRVVVVGLVGMTIDRDVFYKRELDLRLSMSYGPGRGDPAYEQEGHDYPLAYVRWTEQRNMEAFLDLVATGRVTPKALVTHRFSIHEAEKAYAMIESGAPHLAVLLTYPDEQRSKIERKIVRAKGVDPAARGGVGFIGLGNYAKGVLLPTLKKVGGVRLTMVATSTGLSALNAGERHDFPVIATDAAEVFADEGTGTVFIATRHDSHASMTAAALTAGKSVFVEKPLATDDAGLDVVREAVRGSPGVLTVGFNRRYAPMLMKAKAALAPRSGPLVMTYRVNAGTIPGEHWTQRGEGGGRIVGEVCHFVDALTYLCGSLPCEVQAIAARGHDDAVSILLRFADGSTGTIVYSSLGDNAVGKEYIEAFANGRVVQLDDFVALTVTAGGKRTVTKAAADKGQVGLVGAFMAAVTSGGEPPIPLEELFAVTEATFAIEEALQHGGAVALSGDA